MNSAKEEKVLAARKKKAVDQFMAFLTTGLSAGRKDKDPKRSEYEMGVIHESLKSVSDDEILSAIAFYRDHPSVRPRPRLRPEVRLRPRSWAGRTQGVQGSSPRARGDGAMSHVFRLRNSLSHTPNSRVGEAYILMDEDGLPASDRILASCQKVSLSGPVAHHPEVEAKFSKMVEGITYECDECHLVTDYAGLCHKHEQLSCKVVGQHFAVYQVMAQ